MKNGVALFPVLIFVLGSSWACSRAKSTSVVASEGRPVGGFKGVVATEAQIKGRLLAEADEYYSINQFLGDYDANGLPSLLGSFDGRTGSSTLQNATPNPVNVMLWQIVMEGVSNDLAQKVCDGDRALNSHFMATAKPICDWQGDAQDKAGRLQSLWLEVMRYDAPESEMKAWIEAVSAQGGMVATFRGRALVKELLESIMMDPYFLLEH